MQSNCLFQYSGIEAFDLLEYDGSLTISQIKKFGNFGLGCFNSLDGELIAFDDTFYHATSDGNLKEVPLHTLVSCVYLMHFSPNAQINPSEKFDLSLLPHLVKTAFSHPGEPFYALKIEAEFEKIFVRSVPPQKKPYPPIEEIVKKQALFEFDHVKATMVGFHFPNYLKGLTFPGFHLHFVTDNLAHGGHVLDFSAKQGTIHLSPIKSYLHLLPDYARNYKTF